LTVAHEKMPVLFVVPTARKGPGFVWATVTVLALGEAMKPTVGGHRPSAVATLDARFVVLKSVAKVPAVLLGQVLVPLVPAVTPPHEKPLRLDPPTENAETLKSPFVLSVAVTALVLEVADTPAPTGHRLIAAARFEHQRGD